MTARGPWYISAAAVRDYLWLTGQEDVTDGATFDAAEQALIQLAIEVVSSGRKSVDRGRGFQRYRLGLARGRISLIVGPGEGRLPALTAVLPGHDDGRGPAPHRRTR